MRPDLVSTDADATLSPSAPAEQATPPPADSSMTVAPSAVPPVPQSGVVVPGYEVLRELGRGGMGVVYMARHLALGRVVALKMILSGAHAGVAELSRFRVEAEAIARLQHPNIVQIYEVGERDGLPFFSLEFCPGGSLDAKLGGTPLPPREAAALVETLARAMQAAHDRGVVHRDLKPANVLLADGGVPKVTDFGLARKLDETGQTATGSVMGTPSYMAPEQAEGRKEVGPPADVYALGAILYECLTGRPPFKAATAFDTIIQVVGSEPAPVRQLNARVPADLETVCLKCLQKAPAQRYPDALALADDLRRFQSGEPIRARPVRGAERVVKWVQRRPALAAMYAMMALVLVLGGVGGAVASMWRRAEAARQQAEDARDQVAREKQQTEAARKQAEEGRRREADLRQRLAAVSYLHQVGLAHREWQGGQVTRALQLLEGCPPELRQWEWQYVHRLCHSDRITLSGHRGSVSALVFCPDRRHLISAGEDGTIRIWDLAERKQLKCLRGHKGLVRVLALSRDGRRVASGGLDRVVRVWDVASGREITSLGNFPGEVLSVTWSHDGKSLAAGSGGQPPVCVYDVATGRETFRLPWRIGGVRSLAFSPDGRRLLGACRDGSLRYWDAARGQELPSTQKIPSLPENVCLSPDGKFLAGSPAEPIVRVWEVATGQLSHRLRGHKGMVNSLSFSRDGQYLATPSSDHTVKVWEAASGAELLTLCGHQDGVGYVAFSDDGRHLASCSAGGIIKVWDMTTVPEGLSLSPRAGWVQGLSFSPDSGRLASAHGTGTIRVQDAETGKLVLQIQADPARVDGVAYSPDGQYLATASARQQGGVRVWNAHTGKPSLQLRSAAGPHCCVAFRPDGQWLASAGFDQRIRIWDMRTGQLIRTSRGDWCVAFSPDGQRVVGGSAKGELTVWDASLGRTLLSLKGHTEDAVSVAYSPDGKRIASASYDRTVRIWDAMSGRLLITFRGHNARVLRVAFSPDGRRVASASDDRTVRIFVTDTGEEALTLVGHTNPVHCLAFSPDGLRIASGGWDQTVKVWDAADRGGRLAGPAPSDTGLDAVDLDWHRQQLDQALQRRDDYATVFHLGWLARAQPWDAGRHLELAHLLVRQGDRRESATHLMHALFLNPRIKLETCWPGRCWQYSDGKFVRHLDGRWVETNTGGTLRFQEAAQLPDCVELIDISRDISVRLYRDRMTLRQPRQKDFYDFRTGGWQDANRSEPGTIPPRTMPGVAASE